MIKLGDSNFSFAQIGHFITDKDWIHPSINQRTAGKKIGGRITAARNASVKKGYFWAKVRKP